MTNRIGGDFNQEAVEAFRAAYALQMRTPENDDVDSYMGIPTDTVSNTSPWLEHTGLWKYPSGKGPDDDLRQPFFPDDYISANEDEDEDEEEVDEVDLDSFVTSDETGEDEMTEEEIENLLAELRDSLPEG